MLCFFFLRFGCDRGEKVERKGRVSRCRIDSFVWDVIFHPIIMTNTVAIRIQDKLRSCEDVNVPLTVMRDLNLATRRRELEEMLSQKASGSSLASNSSRWGLLDSLKVHGAQEGLWCNRGSSSSSFFFFWKKALSYLLSVFLLSLLTSLFSCRLIES